MTYNSSFMAPGHFLEKDPERAKLFHEHEERAKREKEEIETATLVTEDEVDQCKRYLRACLGIADTMHVVTLCNRGNLHELLATTTQPTGQQTCLRVKLEKTWNYDGKGSTDKSVCVVSPAGVSTKIYLPDTYVPEFGLFFAQGVSHMLRQGK